MKKLSIIIVSWNARELLRACLRSIADTAAGLSHEVIVIDNASGDGSPDMVTAEFPDVHVVRLTENAGFARANNLGLRLVSGSHVALINSDVVVHPQCFQRLLAFVDDHPRAGLVSPKIFDREGKLQPNWRRRPTLWNTLLRVLALDEARDRLLQLAGRAAPEPAKPREVEVLSGCFWVAPRLAIERVGGLDERFFFYAEDLDWSKRFREDGWQLVLVPSATATHFGGGSSANAPFRFSVEMLRADLAYWRKHHGAAGASLFYSMCVLHHGLRLLPRALAAAFPHRDSAATGFKYTRSKFCLRWLLLGKEA